jgi:hypothetical protein
LKTGIFERERKMKWIKIAELQVTIKTVPAIGLSIALNWKKRELQIGILNVFITAKWVWLLYL